MHLLQTDRLQLWLLRDGETTIIGHCEERNDKAGILAEAGVTDTDAVNRLLNQEIKCAIERGMKVLYCIGEKSEEQEQWQEVLGKQLEIGLKDVDYFKSCDCI